MDTRQIAAVTELGLAPLRIYMQIAAAPGPTTATVDTLAGKAGISRRQAFRGLRILRDAGVIAVTREPGYPCTYQAA